MMRKYGLIILIVAIGLLAASRFFGHEAAPEATPKIQANAQSAVSAQPAAETASSRSSAGQTQSHERSTTRSDLPDDTQASIQNSGPAPMATPDTALFSNDPHAIYSDSAAAVGDRFAALAKLAAGGDKDARYFALQIARHCSSSSKTADDRPAAGQDAATDYQIQLRSQMKAACVQVLSDAMFPNYAKLLQARSAEEYDKKMRQTIELFFADKGSKDALRVAVSAIAQRPDDLTVASVSQLLSDLDISSVYFRPDMVALAPDDAGKRNELMGYALNLLSCQKGRPCGPQSYAVQSTCLAIGACAPGADLLGVYQSQLLDAQEMAYVRALLEYLKTIPANVYW